MLKQKNVMDIEVEDKLVGKSMLRKEDLPLLTGTARFVDDLRLPGMLYAKILRSPYAHARLKNIDTSRVREMPGVCDILTAKDIIGKVEPWGDLMQDLLVGDRFPFATDKVMYEGQEVAAVVAETKYQVQDAIEVIEVDYEELRVVVDPEDAIKKDAPLIQEGILYEFGDGNVFDRYKVRVGDMDRASEEAEVVVRQRFVTNRPVGAALEAHGCVADYDTFSGMLTLYSSTQSVFMIRDVIAKALHLPRNKVRVVALDVGAGFGSKTECFPHEVIACLFSMRLGKPVKLMLDRSEVFLVGTARCNQVRYAEIYVKKDGTIIGYKDHIIHNVGAVSAWGNQIVHIGTQTGMLPYPIPNIHIDGFPVHTNTTSGGPLRGFGVPQTLWAKEQLIDMAAEKLGMDPVEIRLKNTIKGADCPVTTPIGQVVDSTSIDACIKKAAEVIGWENHFRSKKANVGAGIGVCMKYSSCRHPSLDTDLSSVRVRVETDGTVTLHSSDVPHGQGHSTMLSQIVSDALGVGFEKINVSSADTSTSPFGLGTYGSRSAVILGTAARKAALEVRDKLTRIAAYILEVDPDDMVAGGDRIYVKGMPETGLWIENLVGFAAYKSHQLPPELGAGPIESVATYDSPTQRENPSGCGNISVTYSGGAHAAVVEVDPGTGKITVLDYVMVHDTGTMINPLIVKGQHQGAFLHGYGMVFGEDLVYDENGRMKNPTFKDYYAPLASDVPDLGKTYEIPAPSIFVPGGQKGAGESATAPVPAVIGNAVYHAIGVRFTELPITPDKVLLALREKERQGLQSFIYPDDMPEFKQRPWPETLPDDDLLGGLV
jgi:carbon-monoxide dehydrogenase large subunit